MKISPQLVLCWLALGLAWSCNALWGIDDLTYNDTLGSGGLGGGSTSTTSSGGLGGSGGAGGTAVVGGGPAACAKTCNDLFDCGLADGNCPGFDNGQRQLFLDGCEGASGCLGQCASTPSLRSFVDPTDCAQTILVVSTSSADFGTACQDGIAGCGGSGGTGGTGGVGGLANP